MENPENNDLVAEVANHLQPLLGDDERLGVLLSLCLGRILLSAARRGEDWKTLATDSQANHIRDWLKAAIVSDSDWLTKLDDLGRPKKLMKFGSVAAIVAEADKAMLKASQSASRIVLRSEDEELHAELANGYYLVRLKTPAALDRESAEMKHCIGNGAYDDAVSEASKLYLSLRSPNGKAHATIEIVDGVIKQLQGKLNERLGEGYMARLIPYLSENKFDVDVPVTDLRYVVDVNHVWHDVEKLPKRLEVKGNLDLRMVYVRFLPAGLKVG